MVLSLGIYKDKLVALAESEVGMGLWLSTDEGRWQPIGCVAARHGALDLLECKGTLVVAGPLRGVSDRCADAVARPEVSACGVVGWRQDKWGSVGNGLNDWVSSALVFRGDLVVGGRFTRAGTAEHRDDGGVPARHVAVWNGEHWSPMGDGIPRFVGALGNYLGRLVAGEYQRDSTCVGSLCPNQVYQWDGSSWDTLGTSMPRNSGVISLAEYEGHLYAGVAGTEQRSGGCLLRLEERTGNLAWTVIDPGPNDRVSALARYGGSLIVAGDFDSIGNKPCKEIARFSE
jgi:hypothetical protein